MAWIFLVLGLALACYREPVPEIDPAETLVLLHPSPWRELDPRFVTEAMPAKISRLVYEPLFRLERADGRPEGVLATGATRVSPVGGPPRWRIRLRQGVRFHDGRPFDCHDVVYTYRSMLDEETGSPFRGGYERKLADVRCGADAHTVELTLQEDYASFKADLEIGVVPRGARPGGPVIGTGPYRLAQRVGESHGLFRRFDDYWGEPARAPQLMVQVVPEESARVLALLGGAGDLCVNGVSPSVAHTLAARDDVRVTAEPAVVITYLLFNLRQPALADRRVRQAIAAALDRQGIVDDLFFGMAEVAHGMLPNGHWAALREPPPRRFDRASAARLLDEAGFGAGPDGRRPIRLNLKVSNNRLRRLIGRRLADDLRPLGIDVDLVSFELGTFLADVRKGNFDLAVLQLPDTLEPDILRWMLDSRHVPGDAGAPRQTLYAQAPRGAAPSWYWWLLTDADPACRAWAWRWLLAELRPGDAGQDEAGAYYRGNRTFYANPRVDCLLSLAYRDPDRATRAARYQEVQRILAWDLPVLPLWREHNIAVHSPRVEGVSLSPTGRYTSLPRIRIKEEAP